MASKPSFERPHNTIHTPPQIALTDTLLASRISLPSNSCIHYALFKPAPNPHSSSPGPAHDTIELARRLVLDRNAEAPLLDSVLPSAHVATDSFLYLFAVSSHDLHLATSPLSGFQFDGLTVIESSSFSPRDVYPSSEGASSHFPDPAKRVIFSHFLEAVRARLIDDIVQTSVKKPHLCTPQRRIQRFKDGFLISQVPASSDWGSAWEYKATSRPLIFCHLEIQFFTQDQSRTCLYIHPTLLPTPFLDLSTSLPLPAGTPITLLPHGTPAYFLASYTGPTAGLIKQFQESLSGLGAGEWCDPPTSHSISFCSPQSPSASFIIGWIKVENKQGEDKGITIIYPTRLCLTYAPTSPPRPQLDYIPDLPAQLQPSPQVPSANIPSLAGSLLSSPLDTSPQPPHSASDKSASRPHSPFPRSSSYPQRPALLSSPTSDSLRAFRSLTLSKSSKDIRRVASEVGGYVDFVARERERERERLKREREGLTSSPKLARATATTPAAAPTPVSADTPAHVVPPTPAPPVTGPNHHPPTSHASSQTQNQTFYPSPPQTNPSIIPSADTRTSPAILTTPLPTIATPASAEPTPAPPPASSSSSSASNYDPFGNIDPSWSQSSQSYLGMDVDMDFGMDMGMQFEIPSSTGGGGGGGGSYDNYRGIDFEDAFTDDDFSFFDQPSRAPVMAPPPPAIKTSISVPPLIQNGTSFGTGMSPPLFGDIHGPSLPHQTPGSSWTPGAFMEGFTPRSVTHDPATVPPELLPPSPGQTPTSHSAPSTPTIQLEFAPTIRRPTLTTSQSLFEPIPFAPYHRAADGKYAIGKFALPSPPDEEDRTESFFILPASTSPHSPPSLMNSWKLRYNAVTDPRVGVVRKLKRKAPNDLQLQRKISSPWRREHEDWEMTSTVMEDEEEDAKSEPESDEEFEENESPLMSRPTTPPPAYLPLGPTLLHTQFQHSHLLPLSTPLRPPGAAVAPTNLTAAPPLASVPTPVSPAATLGAASEKSKSLEAAASAVAVEVVENALWAETWRANAVRAKQFTEVWSADVKTVAHLLESMPALESPLDMATLFGIGMINPTNRMNKAFQVLEAPMISIGKNDAVIQVLPPALRFWEKLGLGPKGGRKNVTAFALYEDEGDQRQWQVDGWLSSLATAYKGKYLGDFKLGTSTRCVKDGLVPLRFDPSFRKSLASFVAGLTIPEPTIIFFIILPITTMSLASPILRQILSAVKKALNAYPDGQVVFQFIPEQYVLGSMEQASASDSHVDVICSSLYNRILLPVDRLMSRRFSESEEPEEPVRQYFQEPSFTLSRPLHGKVSYVHAAHASLDVMDRHTLLHVGYCISHCGKWILATCVDQRGEAYDLGVWLTQTPGEAESDVEMSEETYVVKKVWDFALRFAKRANVEWRIAFAKLGSMSEAELGAWTKYLSKAIFVNRELTMGHISLISVEQNAPWTLLTTRPSSPPVSRSASVTRSPSTSHKHQAVFTDVSSTTYALFPAVQLPISLPLSFNELSLGASDNSTSTSSVTPPPSLPHPLSYLPRSQTTLIRVPCSPSPNSITMLHIYLLHTLQCPHSPAPHTDESTLHADITRNFHELAVLAKERLKLDVNPILPYHLADVEAMRVALDRDWDRMDNSSDA
ncbi:mediator complex subunit 13 C-terminal-domain-containing protein [Crucibulum laeve]|uniref:Mediator of RNA polymerase II transcription subunit 13 n=1 Tax=Crucibulum laeve TaxID=68775 RepID=A0A5C3MGT2_9AGAR|nr:mediator complex subunit 13 C-terminal-domain-containing protein [Crucibulum laeve]